MDQSGSELSAETEALTTDEHRWTQIGEGFRAEIAGEAERGRADGGDVPGKHKTRQ